MEIQEAQARWKEGTIAFDRHDFEKAWLAFKQAYAAYPHPAFLQNLGETELRTGRALDAARHLSEYLRRGVRLTESERGLASRSLQKASEQLGAIVIASDTKEAEVRIDGELVGTTPLEDEPWYVEPGKHSILVHKDGHVDVNLALSIRIGAPTKFVISLKPNTPVLPVFVSASASGTRLGRAPAKTLDSETPKQRAKAGLESEPILVSRGTPATAKTALQIGEGVLTVAGIALGTVFAVKAGASQRRIDDLRAQLALGNGYPCRAPSPGASQSCAELSSALDEHAVDGALLTAGFVGAGLGALALLGTAFLWRPESARKDSVSLVPSVTSLASGVSVKWSY